MSRIGAIAILVVLGAVSVVLGVASKSDCVASVDGVVISREAYEQYARVFTSPDGSLIVSDNDVLLSLVNQVLVQREADRRGLRIAQEDLAAAIGGMRATELVGSSLSREGGEAALRERVRMFLLFGLVKAQVVGTVEIPLDAIRAAYEADPGLQVLGFADAVPVLQERMTTREAESRWSNWLSSQRACADVRILDASFDIPSSTPRPGCGAWTDG